MADEHHRPIIPDYMGGQIAKWNRESDERHRALLEVVGVVHRIVGPVMPLLWQDIGDQA